MTPVTAWCLRCSRRYLFHEWIFLANRDEEEMDFRFRNKTGSTCVVQLVVQNPSRYYKVSDMNLQHGANIGLEYVRSKIGLIIDQTCILERQTEVSHCSCSLTSRIGFAPLRHIAHSSISSRKRQTAAIHTHTHAHSHTRTHRRRCCRNFRTGWRIQSCDRVVSDRGYRKALGVSVSSSIIHRSSCKWAGLPFNGITSFNSHRRRLCYCCCRIYSL